MGHTYIHKVLGLLVIPVFLSSLLACFGGINPNDIKATTTRTSVAFTGTIEVPSSLVAAASTSALKVQGLQVAKASSTIDTSTTKAPDGTLVEFSNSQLKVIDSVVTTSGKYSVDLNLEDYLNHVDPNFLTVFIRVVFGDNVQMRVISEPLTQEAADSVKGNVATLENLSADVSSSTTGVALSILKQISTDFANPNAAKDKALVSASASNPISGENLYHSIRMYQSFFSYLGELFPAFVNFIVGDGDSEDENEFTGGHLIYQSMMVYTINPDNREELEGYKHADNSGFTIDEAKSGLTDLWSSVKTELKNKHDDDFGYSKEDEEDGEGDDQHNQGQNQGQQQHRDGGADGEIFSIGQEGMIYNNLKVEMMVLSACYYMSLSKPPAGIPKWEILRFFHTGDSSYAADIVKHCGDALTELFSVEDLEDTAEGFIMAVAIQNNLKTLGLFQESIPKIVTGTDMVNWSEDERRFYWLTNLYGYDVLCLDPKTCKVTLEIVDLVYQQVVATGKLPADESAQLLAGFLSMLTGTPSFMSDLVVGNSIGEERDRDSGYEGWAEDDKVKDQALEDHLYDVYSHKKGSLKVRTEDEVEKLGDAEGFYANDAKRIAALRIIIPAAMTFYINNTATLKSLINGMFDMDADKEPQRDIKRGEEGFDEGDAYDEFMARNFDLFNNPIANRGLIMIGQGLALRMTLAFQNGSLDPYYNNGVLTIDNTTLARLMDVQMKGLIGEMTGCSESEDLKAKFDMCGVKASEFTCDPFDPQACAKEPDGTPFGLGPHECVDLGDGEYACVIECTPGADDAACMHTMWNPSYGCSDADEEGSIHICLSDDNDKGDNGDGESSYVSCNINDNDPCPSNKAPYEATCEWLEHITDKGYVCAVVGCGEEDDPDDYCNNEVYSISNRNYKCIDANFDSQGGRSGATTVCEIQE
jgi:hypothetical protein